ncbi:MAG: S-layer homology domain-containing protein [Solibacillus sp.]|uniref:S-layer homology domain-containing protein n=1 Tax=Solibacillus sp. TaxID=1909654 RepID=UPI00331598F3
MSKQNTGRKFFATAATAALVASAIVPVASAAEFTDADKIASWATEAVEALAANEVISGNPDGSFNPAGTVTRAEAAKMFTVALGLDTKGTETFADVKDGQWFQEYVVAVVNAGIVNGMTTTEFAPNGKLTREQAAKMIVEAYGLEGEADLSAFADAKSVAGKWSEGYLATAVENGIIAGKGDKLAATDSISRQEFAVMLNRAINVETVDTAAVLAEAVKALETATAALTTEVAIEKIAEAKATVATANEAITAVEEAAKAAELTEEEAKEVATKVEAAKKAVETTEAAIAKAEEAAKELAVESVTAESATKLVVKFTKAVDKNTLSVGDFTISPLDLQTLTAGTLVGTLSEDGKTYTIETAAGQFLTKRYDVKVIADSIKSVDGSAIAAFETTITVEDKTAPAITTTEVVQAASNTVDVTVNFTEQLSSVGTVSVDGVAVASSNLTFTANGKKLVITGLKAGKTYKVDVVGATDVAGNLANPLSTTVVTEEDAVAPTVALSAKETTITLDFSEEVTNAFVVTVNGTTITAPKVQDSKDKTVYTVDASEVLTGSLTFLNNAEVKVTSIVDLAGNAGKVATLTTNLVKDTTAPKFVSSFIEDNTLVLKYDEAIKSTTAAAITNAGLTIKYADKDGVQHSLAAADFTAVTAAGYDLNGNGSIDTNTDEEKYVSITLAEASTKDFITAAGKLVTGKYTVTVAKDLLTDAVGNQVAASTFTVETSATAATKSVLFSVNTTGVETNEFVVVYNETMDASALEVANYTLGGAKLPEGTKLAFVNDKKNVLVTLPEGYITVTGARNVEVANVVAISGNTQDVKTQTKQTVTLNENVAPVAKTVTINNDVTATVDFNEALASLATVSGVTVKVNGAKVTPTTVAVSNGDLVITLSAALKATDKVTVEFESTNIADAAGNKVKDASINN